MVGGVATIDRAPEGTLRLSEAARRCGLTVDVLKALIAGRHLPGVVRSASGHAYLREDSVPAWEDVAELLEHRLRYHVARSESLLTRVREELEAVGNDLALAAEAPLEQLGFDLMHFDPLTGGRHEKTFGAALLALQMGHTFA